MTHDDVIATYVVDQLFCDIASQNRFVEFEDRLLDLFESLLVQFRAEKNRKVLSAFAVDHTHWIFLLLSA